MSTGRVLIASPYATEATRGNSVSARRIAGILTELGYHPQHVEGTKGVVTDAPVMIALHARKSAPAIQAFKEAFPEHPLIVLLTGSDLYADLFEEGEFRDLALKSMALADRLVVCQDKSLNDIPLAYRDKLTVVPKSVDVAVPTWQPPARRDPFLVLLASHLRPVKDPLLVTRALALVPASSQLQVVHYGKAETPSLGDEAKAAVALLGKRYQWKGEVARETVMQALSTSHLALNTSQVEGGANALCEPLVMGMPCLATSIPANEGMLGKDYPGLFPKGDATALADILLRAEHDTAFFESLTQASLQRGPRFTRTAERDQWQRVLGTLLT